MKVNKDAKSIHEPGYSVVLNQCLTVGRHIFSLGTYAENYMVHEAIVTDEMTVDDYGYLCVILQGVDVNVRIQERIELLACSLHVHDCNDFLTREEAEAARAARFAELMTGNHTPTCSIRINSWNILESHNNNKFTANLYQFS